MRKQLLVSGYFFLLASCGLLFQAQAQQDKWMPLGKGQVSSVSTETYIPADMGVGTVCSLRFKVEDEKSLEIREVTVHFGNSQVAHFSVDYKLGDDVYSPSIALQGIRRTVKSVDLVYDRVKATSGLPTVDLWGNGLIGSPTCPR